MDALLQGVVSCATVISLRSRPDRLARFQAQGFGSCTVCPQDPHPRGPREGCFAGHVDAWRRGAAEGGSGAQLVYEDDAAWSSAGRSVIARARAASAIRAIIAAYPEFDLIALGGVPLTLHSGCVAVDGIDGVIRAPFSEAHAYVISAAFRSRALRGPHYGAVDLWLARNAAQCFCVVPELITQDEACGSDNGGLSRVLLRARSLYKAYATRARAACGRVPLYHAQTLLLTLGAFALGAAVASGNARGTSAPALKAAPATSRWFQQARVAALVMLLSVLVTAYIVDAIVLSPHAHDSAPVAPCTHSPSDTTARSNAPSSSSSSSSSLSVAESTDSDSLPSSSDAAAVSLRAFGSLSSVL